jgi:hypothetical protein
MELYEIFSNRVNDLCSAICYQLRDDPALQNESYIDSICAMRINLEMVIADAKQSNSGGDHSITIEQESSPLDGIVDDSAVDGLSQRYEGFLLNTLYTSLSVHGANPWAIAILHMLSFVVVLR